jgi:hypothetical protein
MCHSSNSFKYIDTFIKSDPQGFLYGCVVSSVDETEWSVEWSDTTDEKFLCVTLALAKTTQHAGTHPSVPTYCRTAQGASGVLLHHLAILGLCILEVQGLWEYVTFIR